MKGPTRSTITAIELGVNLLGWYATSFSDQPDSEDVKLPIRILLDNVGLSNILIPQEREARSRFLIEVAMRLDVAGKNDLSTAVRLGWGLAAYDEYIQAQDKNALDMLIQLANSVGISESNIRVLVTERKSVHQPDQADILLKHIQSWLVRENPNTAPYVFLCHASEDKEKIRSINDRLMEQGYRTWLDEKDILPGQDWDKVIRKAIKGAAIVIVFLSSRSISKRGYVQKEVKMVLDTLQEIPEDEIFLIPALLEECEIPDSLSRRQAVKLFKENGFDLLLRALETQLRKLA